MYLRNLHVSRKSVIKYSSGSGSVLVVAQSTLLTCNLSRRAPVSRYQRCITARRNIFKEVAREFGFLSFQRLFPDRLDGGLRSYGRSGSASTAGNDTDNAQFKVGPHIALKTFNISFYFIFGSYLSTNEVITKRVCISRNVNEV